MNKVHPPLKKTKKTPKTRKKTTTVKKSKPKSVNFIGKYVHH